MAGRINCGALLGAKGS